MKKLISILLCLLLLPVLAVQALMPPVQDNAGLLSDSEISELNQMVQEIRSVHPELDVVILTTDSLGGKSAQACADDYFDANYGENGVLFLVDMGSRSWHISTLGTAVDLLTEADLADLEDAMLYDLSNGRYFRSFQSYLDTLALLLEPEEASFGAFFLIAAVPGAILAGIILAVMVFSMNTKRPQRSAADYTRQGSFRLRTHQDLFLYSQVSKRPKPKQTNSSGSTTHRSSSGRSHGGRGGKF